MASVKFSEPWNGIQRTNGNYHIESCYAVYHDPDRDGSKYYICMNGFSLYADTREDLAALLPATITVQIADGSTYSFTTGVVMRTNLYSPSGNLMRYAITVTSQTEMDLPETNSTFSMHVEVTTADHATYSFNEAAHGPVEILISPPSNMTTGNVYDFTLSRQALTGTNYSNDAILHFSPKVGNVTVMNLVDYGYVDPYTRVSAASAAFSTVQFAVANPGYLVDYGGGNVTWAADVNYQCRYMSSDFHNGMLITDTNVQVPLTVREEVADALKPNLTASLVTVTGTNAMNVGHTAYIHRQSMLTFTPAAQFKYGDSLAYIRSGEKNTFSSSITAQAEGVAPGTSYTRPDTGATVTAGEETVGSATLCVCGTKWGLLSDDVTVTYNVLWYLTPRVDDLSVHRAVRVTTSTSYRQDGYYYKKDDFGQYCIVEYTVSYASLSGQNDRKLTLLYGSASKQITLSSATQSGFYVFAAGDSAMNVALELTDNFYPYGILATVRLSTSGILLDYLSGGKGMAVGKTATEQKTLDIARDWKLLFYQADVGAYNDDTSSEDLIAWMHETDARLTALEQS